MIAVLLASAGLGVAQFGQPQARVVATLSAHLGRPTATFANSGCSRRYTEVEWGRLYVEFRSHRFSGWRYLSGRWLGTGPRPPAQPRLATRSGLTLGSPLPPLATLNLVGTDRYATRDNIVLYEDRGRIVELKTGTCGDF